MKVLGEEKKTKELALNNTKEFQGWSIWKCSSEIINISFLNKFYLDQFHDIEF